ncbi:MAG: MarR family winged helix-turn-helix transcriptional regulator [Bacillota bacterium]
MDAKDYQESYFSLLAFEKNFRQFTQKKIGETDLTLSQLMIMQYLHSEGSCGQKELTVTFNASSASMTVAVARLEEKGFIVKTSDEEDKRNNIICLSEEGEATLLAVHAACRGAAVETDAEPFSKEDLRQLKRLQNKLFQRLKDVAVAAGDL